MEFFSAFMLFLLTSYFLRDMSLYAHHCIYISNSMDYYEAESRKGQNFSLLLLNIKIHMKKIAQHSCFSC